MFVLRGATCLFSANRQWTRRSRLQAECSLVLVVLRSWCVVMLERGHGLWRLQSLCQHVRMIGLGLGLLHRAGFLSGLEMEAARRNEALLGGGRRAWPHCVTNAQETGIS